MCYIATACRITAHSPAPGVTQYNTLVHKRICSYVTQMYTNIILDIRLDWIIVWVLCLIHLAASSKDNSKSWKTQSQAVFWLRISASYRVALRRYSWELISMRSWTPITLGSQSVNLSSGRSPCSLLMNESSSRLAYRQRNGIPCSQSNPHRGRRKPPSFLLCVLCYIAMYCVTSPSLPSCAHGCAVHVTQPHRSHLARHLLLLRNCLTTFFSELYCIVILLV